MQADPAISGTRIAAEIIPDRLFTEKFRTALAVVMRNRTRDCHFVEEVTQEAFRTIHQYFVGQRLSDYSDLGEDEFGGWLFVLCRRHLNWAVLHLSRKRAHVGHQEMLADTPSSTYSVSEHHYEQALELVLRTIRRMKTPLQGVMLDDLNGVRCDESARARGITKNYVAILRTKGREILKRVLADQMMPLIA